MSYLFYILLFFQGFILLSADTPKYDWPHEISDLEVDSRIVYGKLENGFRYVFMPNKNLPKHFSVRLYVKAGSLMEEEHERGLAHFLEHMAFKGIKGYPGDEMIKTLQDLGVKFGPHNNATTYYDRTVYKLDCMDNTPDHWMHALQIMAGIADRMLLDPDLINIEKDVILAEKESRDDAQSKVNDDYRRFLYPGSRINNRQIIGLESVIKSANPLLLRNFYKKWYRPERMILVIVGDLDRDQIESKIKEAFSTFSDLSEAPSEISLEEIAEQGTRFRIYKDEDLNGIGLRLVSLKSVEKEIDNQDLRKKDIYLSIAYDILAERMKLAKKINPCAKSGEVLTSVEFNKFRESLTSADCKPEKILEVLYLLENELRRVFEYGFTDEEFHRAKRESLYFYKSKLPYDEAKTTDAQIDILLDLIIDDSVYTSYKFNYELAKNFLNHEATKEECLKVFMSHWDMNNLNIYLSTNSNLKYTEKDLKNAYNEASQVKLEAPKEESFFEYSYKGSNEDGVVVKEHYNKDLDCYQYHLSNNIRVNLKKTDYDKDRINYRIDFGNGLDEPDERLEGLEAVADEILYYGGVGGLSFEELKRAIAGTGLEIPYIEISSDAFTVSSSIETESFKDQMNLICGYLMEPSFRNDELDQMHIRIQDYYDNYNKTVDGIVAFEVTPYLVDGDPDYVPDSLEELKARTPDEVKNWLNDALKESYMEISIVGDFNRNEVIDSLLKTVGTLPKRKESKKCYKEYFGPSLRETPDKHVFSYHSSFSQATNMIYWKLPKANNFYQWYIDYAKRNILVSVMDERLRQRIRLELGEGYSPYANLDLANSIKVTTLTDPEKANYLCDLMTEIAENLAANGIDENEFKRALSPILLGQESQKFTNDYWLNRLARSQENPDTVRYLNFVEKYYNDLELHEINAAAKEYFKPENAIKVVIVPESQLRKVEQLKDQVIGLGI